MTAVLVTQRGAVAGYDNVVGSVAEIDGLALGAAAGDLALDLVVIDAALTADDELRQAVVRLIRAAERTADLFLWWDGDAADDPVLTTEEILRFGTEILDRPEQALPASEPDADACEEIASQTDRGTSEFTTLLGTAASREPLGSLITAIRSMRRHTPPPLYRVGGAALPTVKDASSITGDLASERWSPVATSSLLRRKPEAKIDQRAARLHRHYLDEYLHSADDDDSLPWEWDPSSRNPRFELPPSVLIVGPTGTGKTAMARQVHQALFPDDHAQRPFVEVPASSIMGDGDRFGHQFFGYTDDAFSNGVEQVGPAVAAAFGTLFIDEVADIGEVAQVGLLTFLTTRMAQVYGIDTPFFVPVQVVAATNKPLDGLRPDLVNRFRMRIALRSLHERIDGNEQEAQRLLDSLFTDPAHNPVLATGPRRGEPTVTRYERNAAEWLCKQQFSSNFRGLIDVVSLSVERARRRRSITVTVEDLDAVAAVLSLRDVSATDQKLDRAAGAD